MIKVLHIHTLPVISGSGLNTFLTMAGTGRAVYQAELACAPGGRLIDLVRGHGMKVITFKHLVQPFDPLHDLLALRDLFFFLKRNPYRIVHTHNSKAGFLGRLAARLAGVPGIVHTVHGFAFHDREAPWRRVLFRNLERMASHWCDRMIFISQPLIDWALKDRILADKTKVVKIYSGIQLDLFHPVSADAASRTRKRWNIREQDAVIGVVSKLWEGKGLTTLIETFHALKMESRDVTLVIVGEGYLRDRLCRLVKGYGLEDSVIFTGFQMDVSEIMGAFDVAVLPSFFEGMGRVLLEAMAMEKPVVASRVGGIPDLVEDGLNGFLVQPGSVGESLDALRRLIDDRELAARMGKEGRKRITGRFSAEKMVESIEKVYDQVLREKASAR